MITMKVATIVLAASTAIGGGIYKLVSDLNTNHESKEMAVEMHKAVDKEIGSVAMKAEQMYQQNSEQIEKNSSRIYYRDLVRDYKDLRKEKWTIIRHWGSKQIPVEEKEKLDEIEEEMKYVKEELGYLKQKVGSDYRMLEQKMSR